MPGKIDADPKQVFGHPLRAKACFQPHLVEGNARKWQEQETFPNVHFCRLLTADRLFSSQSLLRAYVAMSVASGFVPEPYWRVSWSRAKHTVHMPPRGYPLAPMSGNDRIWHENQYQRLANQVNTRMAKASNPRGIVNDRNPVAEAMRWTKRASPFTIPSANRN